MKQSLGAKALVMPTPVLLVGTYDKDDQPNIMTVAWGGICCSKPPCVNISVRKATYTYASLTLHKAFTVNLLSENLVREIDYAGIYSGKQENKFKALDLTPEAGEHVHAPAVAQAKLVHECKLIHFLDLGLHTLFIGEVLDTKAEPEILGPDGKPDIEKLKPMAYTPGAQLYYGIGNPLGKAFSIGKTKS